MDKKLACQPVKITKLNSTKSGIAFFNANQGSRIEDTAAIDFKNESDDGDDFKLINVKDKKDGLFTVTGLIKWSEQKKPVTIKGKNGNPSTQKYVRDGIITDNTHNLPISVWDEGLISTLEENTFYKFTIVSLRRYFGFKLSTTMDTTVKVVHSTPPEVDWETVITSHSHAVLKVDHTELCCPTILNAEINIYAMCTKSDCGKKVVPFSGEITVRCNNCDRKMSEESCKYDLNATIELHQKPNNITLTVFSNVLDKFFETNVVHTYKDNKEDLEDKILRSIEQGGTRPFFYMVDQYFGNDSLEPFECIFMALLTL